MKKIFVFICVFALMQALTLPVFADTPDSGTINSTILNYFIGVVNKLPENSDYVIYRSGDYSGTLVYGYDFVLNGNNISSSEECTKIVYDTRGSGSTGYYTPSLKETTINSYSLDVSDDCIIYSSLGYWASVGDTSKNNISYILWAIVFLILLFVFFKFFRNRRHYINL